MKAFWRAVAVDWHRAGRQDRLETCPMHAKHTKQAGQARYANQANQAGRQGKPGRAQAVATQLSPISKLDVCRSATCISSQQDRNMFILSLAIPTHWQPQSVATPLPPISKLEVFLFATYIFSTGSQNVYLFFCLIHTLAGTSSVNAAISNFKIGRLSVCDLYVFSTGSQNVYLFLGHISHMGHVCLAAGSFPTHFGTTLIHLCVCLAAGCFPTHFGTTLLHLCVCLAAGSSPFVLAPHRFTCLSVCQHTSVHITPLDRVEGSSGDGLQRPRLKHYFCRTKSNSSLSEWLHRIIEDKTFWSQRNAESTSFFD